MSRSTEIVNQISDLKGQSNVSLFTKSEIKKKLKLIMNSHKGIMKKLANG